MSLLPFFLLPLYKKESHFRVSMHKIIRSIPVLVIIKNLTLSSPLFLEDQNKQVEARELFSQVNVISSGISHDHWRRLSVSSRNKSVICTVGGTVYPWELSKGTRV